jgi:hypothetical protein
LQLFQFSLRKKGNEELLLELEHLDKELDVENKLQTKIDRLFKRFFQIRGMKSLIGPGESTTPALAGTTTVFELTATMRQNLRTSVATQQSVKEPPPA